MSPSIRSTTPRQRPNGLRASVPGPATRYQQERLALPAARGNGGSAPAVRRTQDTGAGKTRRCASPASTSKTHAKRSIRSRYERRVLHLDTPTHPHHAPRLDRQTIPERRRASHVAPSARSGLSTPQARTPSTM